MARFYTPTDDYCFFIKTTESIGFQKDDTRKINTYMYLTRSCLVPLRVTAILSLILCCFINAVWKLRLTMKWHNEDPLRLHLPMRNLYLWFHHLYQIEASPLSSAYTFNMEEMHFK